MSGSEEPPSQPRPEGEPSVEEILASIRRMLNEPEGTELATETVATGGAVEEVFQLDESMLVEAPMSAPEVEETPAVIEMMENVEKPVSAVASPEAAMLRPEAASAAAQSLGSLRRALGERQAGLGRGGLTLEEIVREELRPLLQSWLDNHLPALIERTVQAEIARLAQRG